MLTWLTGGKLWSSECCASVRKQESVHVEFSGNNHVLSSKISLISLL